MKLKNFKLSELKPHPQNPNTHSEVQLTELQKSLEQLGQFKNIVVWDGFILAGHGLVEAAKRAGLETLKGFNVSGITEEQAKKILIADNRLADMGVMDNSALFDLLRGFDMPTEIPGIDTAFMDVMGGMFAGDEISHDSDDLIDDFNGFRQENLLDDRIVVHFGSESARAEFSALIGQQVTEKTKFIHFPKRGSDDCFNHVAK